MFDMLISIGQSQGAEVTARFAGSYVQEIFDWVLIFMLLSVTVRRLHDVDCNGWFVLLLYVLPVIIMKIEMAALYSDNLGLDPGVVSPNALAGALKSHLMILFFVSAALIASLIIFCKPGTEGPNSYGADPIRSVSISAEEK